MLLLGVPFNYGVGFGEELIYIELYRQTSSQKCGVKGEVASGKGSTNM